jgi:GH35 family endo-1,4-beta-xylanase
MTMTVADGLDQRIRQHRSANATVTLSHNGIPITGREIVVAQKNHKFLFGANWGHRSNWMHEQDQSNIPVANARSLLNWDRSSIALANGELSGAAKAEAETHHAHFMALFNQVTLPFYWGGYEAQQGKPQTERLLTAARWFKDQGCVVKGHPLCWHTAAPDWLLPMSNQAILETQLARVRREVSDFAGAIDLWDGINETVIMPIYTQYDNGITRICRELGRIELIRRLFETARAVNPKVTLLVNDFDTSSAYDVLIDSLLATGVRLDVIGIQSHMHHGYWGVEKTQEVLARFARFNLPMHFTENSFLSGHGIPPEIHDLQDYQVADWPSTPEGEERQCEQVVSHYKTLFAYPSVEAITWWDMSDGAWLNAPAGLLRRDQTPKPAYDALRKLIKGEWWLAPTRLTTDERGQVMFSSFPGEYELTLGSDKVSFALIDTGDAAISVTL